MRLNWFSSPRVLRQPKENITEIESWQVLECGCHTNEALPCINLMLIISNHVSCNDPRACSPQELRTRVRCSSVCPQCNERVNPTANVQTANKQWQLHKTQARF